MRHLADAQFVHDFAGLLVPPWIYFCALVLGHESKCLLRDGRIVGERLKRRDQTIPTKQRDVPWHARREKLLSFKARPQNVKIAQ
jgi:hypothetical protein